MCKFFSCLSDGAGKVYFLNAEQRREARANRESPDSHSFIAHKFGFDGRDEDMLNKYEYDFKTGELTVDSMPNKDDRGLVKAFIETLNEKELDPIMYARNHFVVKAGSRVRFRTEQEFIDVFGSDWMYGVTFGWNRDGDMNYLFGTEFTVKSFEGERVESVERIEHTLDSEWWISADMLTEVTDAK
jgi:hypothetical protein